MPVASNRYALRAGETAPPEPAPAEPKPLGEENAEHGYLHSFETGGTVDGPGIRFVMFLTGCQLRCLYCHNPDTWRARNGRRVELAEVMAEVDKYAGFLKRYGGGVTISGGEPLVQFRFVRRVMAECKRRGIHTALDTNGYLGDHLSDADLELIDLVLLDLKAWDEALHQRITGVGNGPILDFARRLAEGRRPAWIRFVLVPGLNDDPDDIGRLAGFVGGLGNVERVEVLPFHKMGEFKWRELGLAYELGDTLPPGPDLVARVQAQFRDQGLVVV
jgi:pyruvate formate lyase activating enzyme